MKVEETTATLIPSELNPPKLMSLRFWLPPVDGLITIATIFLSSHAVVRHSCCTCI
jgi:hypothetical protein